LNRNPDSVAISLLFSFKNQNHERKLLEALRARFDAYSVISSEVLPEFREFERTSTTVLEAYLGPLVIGYLKRLDVSLSELCPNSKLNVMQSNGGTMLASRAHGRAIGLAISGLAGGAIGGWEIARQNDVSQAITLDMGGTSCDISAILGRVVVRPDNEVGGLPLRVPSVDVKTIGAGGGSVAWVDDAGILHVGPQSAGAVPGPAAYGTGGEQATVTDANLILGRLNPDYFLGGKLGLDVIAARSAIDYLSEVLGMSVEDTALGIIRISTANMVQAIREVTVERGTDPRDFVLIPFGGAGPTQAIDIANELSIDRIIVPPHPGITSAMGLVCTDLRVDLMRTILLRAIKENQNEMFATLEQLTAEAETRLIDQGAGSEIKHEWKIDMRYSGQSHELSIDIPQDCTDIVGESIKRFENLHEESFGFTLANSSIEWVTGRTKSVSISRDFKAFKHEVDTTTEPIGSRRVLLNDGTSQEANIYRRWKLSVGQVISGPSVIEQLDTTTYLSPNWVAEQRVNGSLLIRRTEQ
jgi:N-methylhydantoinase A